ncbi:hypothetical protein BU14_0204s0020 [Porphyra umbilicalis]|uniref:LITAF domain-containing protein n=1 Tax=Porphyra umbilicalis TaxID=2786 RepID=A0A1X6P5R1_PORUM|nr:hypothetical protein BU14_0204s0020 [Porphyra umbilicalis]|eukprot:OSX76174.1 hypothetical protein BU14_0204s0020 [Porphyra umbilicalis]
MSYAAVASDPPPTGEAAPLTAGAVAAARTPGGPLPAVWGGRPTAVTCPGCCSAVTTEVVINECTGWNWLICVASGGLFCVFLPRMFDCASRAVHRCPNCGFPMGEGFGEFWAGKD